MFQSTEVVILIDVPIVLFLARGTSSEWLLSPVGTIIVSLFDSFLVMW